jgi:hypothetical protein
MVNKSNFQSNSISSDNHVTIYFDASVTLEVLFTYFISVSYGSDRNQAQNILNNGLEWYEYVNKVSQYKISFNIYMNIS